MFFMKNKEKGKINKKEVGKLWLRLFFVVLVMSVIGFVLISRHGKDTREPTKENFPSWERINQFIFGGWDFKLLGETEETATRGTKAELLKNLGAPESYKILKEDWYDGYGKGAQLWRSAESQEWFYDNGAFYIKFIKPNNEEGEIIISRLYIVSFPEDTAREKISKKYKMKWGLDVGSSKKKVKEVLGKPIEEENLGPRHNVWIYQYIEGAPSYVRFYFRGDTIYKIEWDFYAD